MSAGNRITLVRLSEPMEAEIYAALRAANITRRLEPYDKSSWIRAAIQEKLNHLKRSKAKKRSKLLLQYQGEEYELDTLSRQPEETQGTEAEPLEDCILPGLSL